MKSLIAIVLSFLISWYFIDLSSDGLFRSVVAPISLFFSFIAFGFWLVLKAGFGRRADGGSGGGFGDGDGGCGGE
ncbi:MAG: hypothetical protein JAY99_01890 [Candidatus Thiodiazotropha lotti]|nr:hypothetical protein [Candidatus Thiodiazotropha lotti]MCG7998254.1 hypothetical protein [Candidatus Thiodiazotropha lotti]MCW4182883.1 hypothetical protein [Candidatus Thiodiazotropha weberae]MCW4190020.1 hypothetical protein [Candidatus Thiodiazotropha weberae]